MRNSIPISGFSIVRNGEKFDYPYLEAYRSILPLIDELIINVGDVESGSENDSTWERVQEFAQKEGQGKVKAFLSDWQMSRPEKKKAGIILSEQTNLALARCQNDWCLYLQADEVIHEQDLQKIRDKILEVQNNPEVEGLLFDYIHFYGSYDVIQKTRSAYRREVRVIRRSSSAQSIGDAQSFRKATGEKLNVVLSGARIFHYGWVRHPQRMKEKTFYFDQLYHGDPKPEDARGLQPHTGNNYQYKKIWGLHRYGSTPSQTHPQVMQERMQSKGWHWDLNHSPLEFGWRDLKKVLLDGIERLTGYRLFEYRSYRRIG